MAETQKAVSGLSARANPLTALMILFLLVLFLRQLFGEFGRRVFIARRRLSEAAGLQVAGLRARQRLDLFGAGIDKCPIIAIAAFGIFLNRVVLGAALI